MAADSALARGRELHRSHAWRDAYASLAEAERLGPLDVDDLETSAIAAFLSGDDREGSARLERAFHQRLAQSEPRRCAWLAYWIAMLLLDRNEPTRANGWLRHAERLLDEAGIQDAPERAYLVSGAGRQHLVNGDIAAAIEAFNDSARAARRWNDPSLLTINCFAQGLALVLRGEAAKGVALFDEAMIAVGSPGVFPIAAGIVYCGVIEACQSIFDIRRAREWTAALSRWCDAQKGLVPFRGQCMLRRAEIMRLHGEWQDAAIEIDRACSHPVDPAREPWLGDAHYQRGELLRLRGAYAQAEAAYREANRLGHIPEPGLLLLWLARGDVDGAAAASRRAVSEAHHPLARARLLAAHSEIMLAAGDIEAARAAARDLEEIAGSLGAPYLAASAMHAAGAVRLAGGQAADALDALRDAWAAWQDLGAPYQSARTRVLIGLACRALGDEAGAAFAFDAALWAFRGLEAVPDAARVESLLDRPGVPGGLTSRELDVLQLIAEGATNREIAASLVISEKTVARHVSNIFTKLDVTSRTAAASFAFRHDLVAHPENG